MNHVSNRRLRRLIGAAAVFAAAVAGLALPSPAQATGTTTTGVLEVCKVASGSGVTGSFQFTVSGATTPVSVPVGGCSTPITVTAGQVTVTESARAGFAVEAIAASPADRLVSRDLAAGRAVVTVPAGTVANQTIVTFTNKTAPPPKGTVKVCKVAGAGVPAGQEFSFTVGQTQTTARAGACSLPIEAPAGDVTVTEAATTDFQVSAITSAPAGTLVSSDIANRTAVVKVLSNQVTEVSFTNTKKTGTVKVCKIAGPGVATGEEFAFTVGGIPTTAKAGACSLPITLPVGNATVKETLPAGYEVTSITVTGAGTLVSTDLPGASAVVTVAVGVTEVNVTNKKPPKIHGCTFTKGYYKNHPEVVATLLARNGGKLAVGGVDLTAAQIDDIFGRNASNYLNQVSQQLIAARLNQLSGASTPEAVQTAINAAQALIQASGGPLTGSATSQTTVVYGGTTYTASALVGVLSSYNEGTAAGGPPHCA
jgi:hypothetical protein